MRRVVYPVPSRSLISKCATPQWARAHSWWKLAAKLLNTLIEHGGPMTDMPEIPPDEDETIFARRLVAQRCLYGVDRNPKAVDLAKLSLWLTTLAKDHPLTFLDHALRYGDSLVGLSMRQLQSFHWKGKAKTFEAGFEALQGREHLKQAAELRQLIQEADEHGI